MRREHPRHGGALSHACSSAAECNTPCHKHLFPTTHEHFPSLRLNPYMEHMYDGLDLSALEAMFVKVKAHLLEANATGAVAAAKYAAWADEQVGLG